jgi:hypothetical protein
LVNVKTVTARVRVVAELEISLEVVIITPSRKAIGTRNKIDAGKVIFTERIYYIWTRLLGKATMSQGWVEKDSLSGQWLSTVP